MPMHGDSWIAISTKWMHMKNENASVLFQDEKKYKEKTTADKTNWNRSEISVWDQIFQMQSSEG